MMQSDTCLNRDAVPAHLYLRFGLELIVAEVCVGLSAHVGGIDQGAD